MNLAALSFVRPWWLLALLPLGVLLWRLWRAPHLGEAAWRGLADAHLLAHLLVFPAPRARRVGLALFAGGLLAAVLAMAGPTSQQHPQQPSEPAYRRDVTRLLVLDLSPDMTAHLEQVKPKLLALLQALPDGQTALLVYGDEPYLVVPPTTDVETIALFIPELATDIIPMPGNHPERALRMAGEILARSAGQQREVLWIKAGAKGAELPLADLAGVRLSILHASTALDPALAAAASRSGGAVVQLRADDGDVLQLVSALETRSGWVAGQGTAPAAAADFAYWLMLALLPLAALAFQRGILALLLSSLLLAGLLTPQPAEAMDFRLTAMLADYQAWRLLNEGNPEAAAARFVDLRWRAAANYRAGHFAKAASLLEMGHDADSHYNRGNALARQGQLEPALAAYDTALDLRADDADTRHNRDLVQRLLNEQSKAPESGGGGPSPRKPQGGPQVAKQAPPAPRPTPSRGEDGNAESEAARVAEQWLRRIPGRPGNLLRYKLLAEQRRRQADGAERAW